MEKCMTKPGQRVLAPEDQPAQFVAWTNLCPCLAHPSGRAHAFHAGAAMFNFNHLS